MAYRSDCTSCGGDRLRTGGWMGPTKQRPYPDPCPDCWPDATPRDVQLRVAELIESGSSYFRAKYPEMTPIDDGRPAEPPTAREAWCAEYGHTWIEGETLCIRCGKSTAEHFADFADTTYEYRVTER